MSKKIHTVQSSDKVEFDKHVNQFLELGGELMDGGYQKYKVKGEGWRKIDKVKEFETEQIRKIKEFDPETGEPI